MTDFQPFFAYKFKSLAFDHVSADFRLPAMGDENTCFAELYAHRDELTDIKLMDEDDRGDVVC